MPTPPVQQTVQNYFMVLKIVPLAMIAGPIFFLLAVLFLTIDTLTFDLEQIDMTFLIVVLAITPLAIFGGNFVYQSLINAAKNKDQLKSKTSAYFTANLIKAALLEGAILLSIVFVFLTSNLAFLIFWAFLIFVQVSSIPSKEKLTQDMQLTKQEIDVLNNPNTIL